MLYVFCEILATRGQCIVQISMPDMTRRVMGITDEVWLTETVEELERKLESIQHPIPSTFQELSNSLPATDQRRSSNIVRYTND